MDRRKSLKLIATGALATPLAIAGCKEESKKEETASASGYNYDRSPDEVKLEEKILSQEKFFSPHEMATLTLLVDIIIPKDEISGSASEAGVPAFLEFIVKDMPQHQIPLRGGLKWLDMESFKTNEKSFVDCSVQQQLALVDQIAYPQKAAANKKQGVKFFTLLRNLTATGFYTSAMGVKDLDYQGNQPTQWNGVPNEILASYKIQYSEKDLKDCISFDTPESGTK
jgi:hypothetical protein